MDGVADQALVVDNGVNLGEDCFAVITSLLTCHCDNRLVSGDDSLIRGIAKVLIAKANRVPAKTGLCERTISNRSLYLKQKIMPKLFSGVLMMTDVYLSSKQQSQLKIVVLFSFLLILFHHSLFISLSQIRFSELIRRHQRHSQILRFINLT